MSVFDCFVTVGESQSSISGFMPPALDPMESKLGRRMQYSVLTPRGAYLMLQDKFQPGSIKGSVFTLIVAIVGAGILSLLSFYLFFYFYFILFFFFIVFTVHLV